MIILIFFLLLLCETGLQKARVLIKKPINLHRQTNDIILSGIVDKLEEDAYKL